MHSVRPLIIDLAVLVGIARGEGGGGIDKGFGGKRQIMPSIRCLPTTLGNSWGQWHTGALGTMVRTLHLGVIFHAPSLPIVMREGMDSQGAYAPPDPQSYFITRLQVKYYLETTLDK